MHALLLLLVLVAHGSVIDRVEVVVDDQLVMSSDIAFERVISELDDGALPFWRADHKTPRARLVDAAVIHLRVQSVTLYDAEDAVVRERMEQIRTHFRDRDAWEAWLARWGLDEDTLGNQLRRRIVVENYLVRNLQLSPLEPGWLDAADALLDELRPGMRIREIPLVEEAP